LSPPINATKSGWTPNVAPGLPFGKDRMGIILIVVLLLLLFGAFPRWPYSRNWGYFPSGTIGLILIIVLILVLLGQV